MLRRILPVAFVLILVIAILTGATALPTIRLLVNGKPIPSDVAPQIMNGRTLVPVRAVAEGLGAKVEWDGGMRTVSVRTTSPGDLPKQAQLLASTLAPLTPNEAIDVWAQGVLTCNGALQYATMSETLRYDQKPGFETAGWITAWPGGWADSYDFARDEGAPGDAVLGYTVTFRGKTDSGAPATEQIRLRLRLTKRSDNGGRWEIIEITYREGMRMPFFLGALPLGPSDRSYRIEELFPGVWDTGAGQIKLTGVPTARINVNRAMAAWDGTSKLIMVPTDVNFLVQPTLKSDEFPISTWDTPVGQGRTTTIGWLTDGGGKILTAIYMDPSGFWDLRINRPTGVQTTTYQPWVSGPKRAIRAVAIGGSLAEPHLYFETVDDKNPGRYGLVEANLAGQTIQWAMITDDLGISEAGAGTRFAWVDDTLYIASQDGSVKSLDVKTASLGPVAAINAPLASFKQVYVEKAESAVPPSLSVFNGNLIVTWEPRVSRVIDGETRNTPVIQSLIYRNGQVICELRIVDGQLTVLKQGTTTQRLTLEGRDDRFMLFPGR